MLGTPLQELQLMQDVINLLWQVALSGGKLKLEEDRGPSARVDVSEIPVTDRAGEPLGPGSSWFPGSFRGLL
jgi:hypothetical protein